MSTLPSVSFQISGPVVLRWIAGLAGFLNCCGMKYSGFLASSSALPIAPFIPSAPGVRMSSAPNALSICRRSTDIVSGIVNVSGYPLAAQTYARAMPVLPLVGSTTFMPGLSLPVFSASQIIDAPMRHLTL